MAISDTTKKVIVWSTVVAILGVGGYFGYKWWKKRKDAKSNDQNPLIDGASSGGDSGSSSGGDSGSGSNSGASSNPFKSEAEIKAFQDWLDKNKPFWILDTDGKYKNLRTGTASEPNRHIGGKGYGSYGENTKKAYALFGSEYIAKKETSPASQSSKKLDAETERAISLIIGKGYGSKVNREYLVKQDPNLLKIWAWSFNNDKTAFSFKHNVYRTKTGDVVLNYDPIGIKHRTNGSIYAYYYPTLKSERTAVNTSAGRSRAMQFNEGDLWLYFPDNGGNYKWARAKDMKIDY